MNEPAQHVATMQSHARSVGFPPGLIWLRGRQAEASVGSRPVVVDGIAAKHTLEDLHVLKPTLVVGVDYLFWFAYGPGPEEKRVERVDKALKGLDALACTVLLCDLPDMTAWFERELSASRRLDPKELECGLRLRLARQAAYLLAPVL